jgi:transcriptional regulator GlxA family with amidase domain
VTKKQAKQSVPQKTAEPVVRFGFLLLPGFPLMSYATAVEPLRAANALAGRTLYEWQHLSFDGAPLSASNGISFEADARLSDGVELDGLFVCAGGNPSLFDDAPTFAVLRTLARRGLPIAGMSGGSYVLARAGLLEGYRCTIHWEHIPAFVEEFPRLKVERTLFVIDRDRITCAGGIAALDMMIEVIARAHGRELAAAVSEWYLRTHPREGKDSQRMGLRERVGVANAKLLGTLALMENRLENPISRKELASAAGITVRQLERLFAEHLKTTIGRRYVEVRIGRARALLRQSSLSIAEVAVACGFVSTSHFSRVYKAQFGLSPRDEREISSRMDAPSAPTAELTR